MVRGLTQKRRSLDASFVWLSRDGVVGFLGTKWWGVHHLDLVDCASALCAAHFIAASQNTKGGAEQ